MGCQIMAAARFGFLCGCYVVIVLQTKTAMTKDKIFNWRFCLCCGLFIWFVINLLQGIFTGIQEDEAYYALYGEHLAWGYFEHPPMVGLMTFLGSLFFSGNLGVRFFTIIASSLSLWVMWAIADQVSNDAKKKGPVLFFVLAFSIIMFNIYGFVTTPDASLILFSALFLLTYQRYLVQETWPKALLLGLFMALMVYSKYHAFLLLGLIVLSNLKLLKDGKFWVACLVALALLAPHVLWQVNNDFPSFRYHLMQRSEPFRWSYFLENLPNQLLVFNPLTLGAVVYVLIRNRNRVLIPPAPLKRGRSEAQQTSEEVFVRGLKFILIGFFFFFWLMAFRGHVEPHWTIACVIPVVVLVYRKALVDEKLRKYILHFILPSLLLVLAFRIVLLTPLASRFGFGSQREYYQAIEQVAGDCPVVFRGSFQQPALYHFYTGKESSSLKGYYDRKTQYDLWQFDKAWVGKEVFVGGPVYQLSKEYDINGVHFEGYLMPHFRTANRLVTSFMITNATESEMPVFHHGDTIRMNFSIHNPCDVPMVFKDEQYGFNIKAHYLPGNQVSMCFFDRIWELQPQDTYHGHLFTVVGDDVSEGQHLFNLGIGDRISSFVTEESGVEIRIVP